MGWNPSQDHVCRLHSCVTLASDCYPLVYRCTQVLPSLIFVHPQLHGLSSAFVCPCHYCLLTPQGWQIPSAGYSNLPLHRTTRACAEQGEKHQLGNLCWWSQLMVPHWRSRSHTKCLTCIKCKWLWLVNHLCIWIYIKRGDLMCYFEAR